MEPDPFLAEGVDFERPNAARMYDYFLGGAHNFAADRARAEEVLAGFPGARSSARANRAFLGNTVRWCLAHGITQFLDLGSGVPTAGNVHEIAHALDPGSRVAYVDFEPVAVAHATGLIAQMDTGNVTITRADVRDPSTVLAAPGVAGLLDFTRPVAVLMVAVLHFVDEDHDTLDTVVRHYLDAVVPGSALVIGHATDDQDDPELAEQLRLVLEAYRQSANTMVFRSRARIRQLFSGLDIVEPGLVDLADWPVPGTTVGPEGGFGGIGLVPPSGRGSSAERGPDGVRRG